MSGYSESNLNDRDLLRLNAILLQKPFSTSSFLARIQEALEKNG
jgi:hypothetical protein